MSLNQTQIKEVIGKLKDPGLGLSFQELNAINNVIIEGNIVKLYLELIQPIHTIAEEINKMCADAIKEIAPDVILEVYVGEKGIQKNKNILPGVKNIIAVASGKGGVGKSSVSSNLAAALSLTGAKVGILDGDVYGPSQPTMYGLNGRQLEAVQMPDGSTKAYPSEQYGVKVASMGFVMNRDDAAIVRGPLLAGYFSMLFEQVDWGELDYLIFDLPPGTGDIQLTLTQKIPLTGAVIVTTPQEIALADVRRSITMFKKVDVDILGIVENMSYFIPPDMPDKKYFIFGEGGGQAVADETNSDLLGQIPLNIGMREGNDGGKPFVLSDESGEQGKIIKDITRTLINKVRKLNHSKSNDAGLKINI